MLTRLAKLLISLAVAMVDWLSAAVVRLFGGRPAPRCVVLYYHAIRPELRSRFAWQMDVLKRLTLPIDIESAEPVTDGRRRSAVTFDDGFVSVVENALPELAARGIPCIIFVPSGCIGHRPSWIEESHDDGEELVADAAVVRSLAEQPLVRIGSHSVSHPNFRRLDDDRARAELMESKQELERITGREVRSFSFPHGAHTQRSLELAKQCGYTQVHTIEPVQLGSVVGQFKVGRVTVEPHDWPLEFRLKVLGAYRWMVRVSAFKRELRNLLRGARTEVAQPERSA